MKKCNKCKIEKPLSEFSKDKNRKDGLQPRCKSCNREYREQNRERIREADREYRERNRERIREAEREWYQNNREHKIEYINGWRQNNPEKVKTYKATRRIRKRGNLTEVGLQQSAEYRKMLEGTPCHYCGTTEGPFHVDHKQPISRGGDDHWTNLVQACESCNLRKNDKTYEEFTGRPDLTHLCVQS